MPTRDVSPRRALAALVVTVLTCPWPQGPAAGGRQELWPARTPARTRPGALQGALPLSELSAMNRGRRHLAL